MDRDIEGKTVVLGLARSGRAAARLLASRGVEVLALDEDPDFKPDASLAGLETIVGEADPSLLEGVERLVISPGVSMDHALVAGAIAGGIEVISEIELASRFARAGIIAVTGTNGKSTTVSMAGAILAEEGIDSRVAGNVGIPFSSVVEELGPGGYFVIEVSSFQLEAIRDFHPVSAGILNLTPDHLDRYDDVEEYYRIKKRVAANCGPGDSFFYNAEDARCVESARDFPGRTIPFSAASAVEGGSFVEAGSIVRTLPGGERESVMRVAEMGVVGLHNLENALAAISAVAVAGVSAGACARALSGFRGLRHRMELVASIGGVSYYNDSKATNVEAAVKSLSGLDSQVVLIAGGYDKGGDYSALSSLAGKVKAVITIGAAAPLIEKAIEGNIDYQRAGSMEDAVARAAGAAGSGDLVVLSPACASFDMFRDFEHRGDVFSRYVRELEEG